jgi:hypothetical protein
MEMQMADVADIAVKPATVVRILRVVHGQRLLKNVPGGFEEPAQETYTAA